MRSSTRSLALGGLIVALAALGVFLVRRLDDLDQDHSVARARERVERTEAEEAPLAPVITEPSDAVESAPADTARAAPIEAAVDDTEPEGWLHVGLVVDLDGNPVPEVGIRNLRDPRSEVVARTGADGRFDMTWVVQHGGEEWGVAGQNWVTVLPHRDGTLEDGWLEDGRPFMRIVCTRALAVTGFVESTGGEPIANALIELRANLARDRFAELVEVTPDPERRFILARSNRAGQFELPRVPTGADLVLSVTAAGFAAHVEPVRPEAAVGIRIALEPLVGDGRVRGVVLLDHGGTPAPGARVILGRERVKAGRDGTFELALDGVPADAPLVASYPDRFPAVLAPDERPPSSSSSGVVRLVLGPAPEKIAGRVVDAEDAPLAGWRVGILDGTPDGRGRFVEQSTGPATVVTDAAGRFELSGLAERAYRLWAADGSGTIVRTSPIAAGTRDAVISAGER